MIVNYVTQTTNFASFIGGSRCKIFFKKALKSYKFNFSLGKGGDVGVTLEVSLCFNAIYPQPIFALNSLLFISFSPHNISFQFSSYKNFFPFHMAVKELSRNSDIVIIKISIFCEIANYR